jgi:hypothetical protein
MKDRQMRSIDRIASQVGRLITNNKEGEKMVIDLFSNRIKEAKTPLEKLALENQRNQILNDIL